jgi:hypothetical protein
LLRFWTVVDDSTLKPVENELDDDQQIMMHVQHLQSGLTWEFNSLQDLNDLFRDSLQNGWPGLKLSESTLRHDLLAPDTLTPTPDSLDND